MLGSYNHTRGYNAAFTPHFVAALPSVRETSVYAARDFRRRITNNTYSFADAAIVHI